MNESLSFDIKYKSSNSLARVGLIKTPHGNINTPCFVVAATKATVKAIKTEDVKSLGGQSVLANTYHLLLQPGVDVVKNAGGLSKFMNFDGPTFTDSGGFQVFSLSSLNDSDDSARLLKIDDDGVEFRSHIDGKKLAMNPDISMHAQHDIGSDIHMAFDQLVDATLSEEKVEIAMSRTHKWAVQCLDIHKNLNNLHTQNDEPKQALYGVVQGGRYVELRKKSAEFLSNLDFDGFGIGGMFTAEGMPEILTAVNSILPKEKPRHLLGMGSEPIDLFLGAENGIDTFDCVAPTRQARNGSLYTYDGRINIKNSKYKMDLSPIDHDCNCEVCRHYSKSYIHHLFKSKEILAAMLASIHNEHFVVNTVDRIRDSLLDDSFNTLKQTFLDRYYK